MKPLLLSLAILTVPVAQGSSGRTREDAPSSAEDTKPALAFLDRASDGTLFGSSSDGLYRSTDSGQGWERLAEQDHLGAVFAFADGSGAVVATEAGLSKWENEEPVLVPVLRRGESEKAVAEMFWGSPPPQMIQARNGSLWIATSYGTDGDAVAERMLRSSDTVRKGPHFTALVYSSADGGRSWTEIDRSQGAIVHALWLGTDDVLRMCMSDGALRTSALDADTGAALSPGFANVTEADTVGGQWASWLAFPNAQDGMAGGNIYFGDSVVQRSVDGGRTWTASDAPYLGVTMAYLLGETTTVRVIGFWQDHSTVEAWTEGSFREIREFSGSGVNDALVDATGCLLVRLGDGEVWSLSPDARTWSRVGLIPPPPR